ncbi:hypothetical protein CRG98_019856 [Punica granatum]|uniref:Uncharacterized protein n=1 Tax=Punica granatum TaxID=22663 RepID=A0A2I0JV76_PUNGR|nr:hypothetical protein CRG98_019856 [Punica granatum]
MSLSSARVGGTQGARSTVDPCARGGVELEDAPFGPRSRAIISAMLAAIRLTVSWRVVTLPSRAVHIPAVGVGTPSVVGAHPLKLAARDTLRVPLDRPVAFLQGSVAAPLGLPAVEDEPVLVG